MLLPAYIPLPEAGHLPSEKVGPHIRLLIELHQKGIPLADCVLIPPATLQKILIKDTATNHQLLQMYQHHFNNDFVSIRYESNGAEIEIENIIGDSNFMQTLWECATASTQRAIMIQANPQPDISGICFTKSPTTGNKKHLEIVGTQGVLNREFPHLLSYYTIDQRTGQVIARQIADQDEIWIRQTDHLRTRPVKKPLNLSSTQLTELTQIGTTIKTSFFADFEIYFVILNNNIYLTKVQKAPQSDQSFLRLIAVGTPFIAGYVQGTAFSFSVKRAKPPATGAILIATKIEKKHLPLLKQVIGVISEQTILDQKVLQEIQRFHLPTVVHAHFITHNTTSGQQLILDAGKGKVFQPQPSYQRPTKRTGIAKILSVGNVNTINGKTSAAFDTLCFSSNYLYSSIENHPLQLTKSDENRVVNNQHDALQAAHHFNHREWFYFMFSMDSDSRQKMHLSLNHEYDELNPSWGKRGVSLFVETMSYITNELTALQRAQHHFDKKIMTNIILPFVKNHRESALVAKHITLNFPTEKWKLWNHLVSPQSLIEAGQKQHPEVFGYVLDLDYVAGAWTGVDPTLAQVASEAFENPNFHEFIKQNLPQSYPVIFFSRSFTRQLVETCKVFHTSGIMTTTAGVDAVVNT